MSKGPLILKLRIRKQKTGLWTDSCELSCGEFF